MPVYNIEKYLSESLDSVLQQTFTDWELICVDDGSTDGSGRILDEYARRDSRIKVIHQANAKVHAARNNALDQASGEWIGFVDPDDVISKCWFETAVGQMKDSVDLVRMGFSHGTVVPMRFIDSKPKRKSVYVAQKDVVRWGWTTFPAVGLLWVCFIRRAVIGDLRFRDRINCKEDGIFLLELLPAVHGVVQLDYAGYFYRQVFGSLSTRRHYVIQTVAFLEAYLEIWDGQQSVFAGDDVRELVRTALTGGTKSDICSWALRHRSSDDPDSSDLIRKVYQRLCNVGAVWGGTRLLGARYMLPFLLWERTGWVLPLQLVGRIFLFAGNILRRLGLRRAIV